MAASTSRLADLSQTVKDTRRIVAEFLLTDLDVALTFLDIASESNNPETVQRNLKHARTAYDTVVRHFPRAVFTKAEQRVFQVKLATLKDRLDSSESLTGLTAFHRKSILYSEGKPGS